MVEGASRKGALPGGGSAGWGKGRQRGGLAGWQAGRLGVVLAHGQEQQAPIRR